ncbi:MAG: lipid-A-disaccharide synthase [Planctomycetota bacterium]|nr:lipid-A-disaccharide synthase [Planctomycetota bacterium]
MRPLSVLICAGEASGDMHGAALVNELNALMPIHFFGICGKIMKRMGVEQLWDLTGKAYVGFFEGIVPYFSMAKVFFRFVKEARVRKPDAAILIDFPEFNMRLAKRLHMLSIPVIYYIVPQVWAWRKHRVAILRRYVDLAIPVLPFEEPFLRRYGVNARFLGHPLRDTVLVGERDAALKNKRPLIGLLPGSRKKEVDRLMPVMDEAARIIRKYVDCEFAIARAESVSLGRIRRYSSLPVVEGAGEVYRNADAALISSGTATLEATLNLLPFVSVYRVSPLTYHLLKMLINVRTYSLTNIIAGKNVVKELLQWSATPERMASAVLSLLDLQRREEIIGEMKRVVEKMGPPGAVKRIAGEIAKFLRSL